MPPAPAGAPALAIELGGPQIGSADPGEELDLYEQFGEVPVGTVSSPRIIELRAPSEFYEISPDFDVTVTTVRTDSGFRVGEDRCTGAILALPAPQACTFEVVFNPSSTGEAASSIGIRMTHSCASTEYWPCSPPGPEEEGQDRNFDRTELSTGQIVISWWGSSDFRLVGVGTA